MTVCSAGSLLEPPEPPAMREHGKGANPAHGLYFPKRVEQSYTQLIGKPPRWFWQCGFYFKMVLIASRYCMTFGASPRVAHPGNNNEGPAIQLIYIHQVISYFQLQPIPPPIP